MLATSEGFVQLPQDQRNLAVFRVKFLTNPHLFLGGGGGVYIASRIAGYQ